jgi:ABC-type transporter Mla subunit MlaD
MHRFQKITLVIISAFFLIGCNALDLTVNFKELHGLTPQAPVILDHTAIGRVKEILPLKDGIYPATLEIDSDFKTLVTDRSTFTLVPGYKDQNLTSAPRTIVMVASRTPGGSPLKDGTVVVGSGPTMIPPEVSKLMKNFTEGFESFKEKISNIPETDEYKQFESSIDELAKSMKESGTEVKEQIKNEILPKIEKEFEAFKQRLKDLQNQDRQDKDTQPELAPLEEKLDNLREI